MNLKSIASVAESYLAMLTGRAAASVSKPKWVPASITEENVAAFVQAVTEARKAGTSVVEFNGKKYGINETIQKTNKRPERPSVVDAHNKEVAARAGKIQKEDASETDQGLAKKIQDAEVENAPKQASDEVPAEVKEEDSEEIKADNHDEKEVKADEMPKVDSDKDLVKEEDSEEIKADEKDEDDKKEDEKDADDDKVEEELSGDQHKLDLNKNGKVDGDDLKKLRGEEKEEGSDEKDADHAEPDADDFGGPSDNDADNEDEDEKDEDEKPKLTGEQVMASLAAAYVKMTEGAPADAEAGPEVMDPLTQQMKDDADDETEIKDGVPGAAQDGGDKVTPADKPAPANKSAALPNVAIVDAPTK